MGNRVKIEGYGEVFVETLSPENYVDASIYALVDQSGQPAEYRERDPFRFVLMAALAYGVDSPETMLKNKKIMDVGCGGGQISICMREFAKGLWVCDPDCADPANPINSTLDPRFCVLFKIQETLKFIPELIGFFDMVTSYAPHPFPLNVTRLTSQMMDDSFSYFECLVKLCRPGGDLLVMPVYEKDLGLESGVLQLLELLDEFFESVILRKVSMAGMKEGNPFFSVFIVAKNKK